MGHSHASHESCPHGHASASGNIRRLVLVLILTATYMVIEFVGGLWANSLALLADAGHMLTDVAAISLALFAAWFAQHPASAQKTYGYYRLEILAAFINGIALAVIALFIMYEAWQRLQSPPEVEGSILMWVATGGLIINLISAGILFSAGRENINMRGAFLHVLSDSLGSMGAIVAGLFILYGGFVSADAYFSILIAILVLVNAWGLIYETTHILLEGAPKHLNVAEIKATLTALPEVGDVHDLHVWSITSGKDALSVHIVVCEAQHFTPALVTKVQQVLKARFSLTHITVQMEPPGFEEDEIHF